MTRIQEEDLVFEFGEQWNVFEFDDHHDYITGIRKIPETKAVDFLAIFNETDLFFIEVKDFRGYRIENRERLFKGELSIELAQKVRDSVACIIGSYRCSSVSEHWKPYAKLLHNRKSPVKVVLWLEQNLPPFYPRLRQKAMASTRTKVFKQKLTWLTHYVLVCGRQEEGLPDLKVSSLPRR